jgi:hypothetical protein
LKLLYFAKEQLPQKPQKAQRILQTFGNVVAGCDWKHSPGGTAVD